MWIFALACASPKQTETHPPPQSALVEGYAVIAEALETSDPGEHPRTWLYLLEAAEPSGWASPACTDTLRNIRRDGLKLDALHSCSFLCGGQTEQERREMWVPHNALLTR